MREFLKITAGGLVVALAVTPALAQTGARPQTQQQAPRNEATTSQPGTTSGSDTSNTNPNNTNPNQMQNGKTNQSPMPNSNTQDSQLKGTMRDNASGSMSNDGMRGMRGQKAGKSNVRQIQEALKAQGHDPGPVDGVMGPQTQEALRAYQRAENLTETGQLDQQTFDKLGGGGAMGQRQQSR